MHLRSTIVILLVAFSLSGLEATGMDSLYVRGARGMVPCNDGSFIGGFINCATFPANYYISDPCDAPSITRSWDGGKTWASESVSAADYAFSGIVRLRGGDLLTAHNRWKYGFSISHDNGHTWEPTFDTTKAQPVQSPGDVVGMLFRDHRGILYWKLGGELHMSLDSGRNFIWLRDSELSDGFYVLPPEGLLVTHRVDNSWSPGSINMSVNHGREWRTVLMGYSNVNRDSSSEIDGAVVIRDTLVVHDDFGYYPRNFFEGQPRTLYWHAGDRAWRQGRYLFNSQTYGVMDSTECWFDGYTALAPEDTVPRGVCRDFPPDSTIQPGDTTVYTRGRLPGVFYDLDGNLHVYGSDAIVPRRSPRPVSRLDRLFTCGGIEYVVGGHHLLNIALDIERSTNARLTFTVTDNRRIATFVATAIDSSIPMRFTVRVDDSIVGTQVFVDSLLPIALPPTIIKRTSGQRTLLEANWPEGPYYWTRDSQPLQHEEWGVNADSVLVNPAPGTYRVVGRSPYGCDIPSNEVTITSTGVNGYSEHPNFVLFTDEDGQVHVKWPSRQDPPRSIQVFDILGRQLDAKIILTETNVVISGVKGVTHLVITILHQDGHVLRGVINPH